MDSQLSFGCHNLTGGSSFWRSQRLVSCALDLGIRRFDVAPSYGLGTAERTLGRALGKRRSDPDLEITTKYGIAPPRFGSLAALLREPYKAFRRTRRTSMPELAWRLQSPASDFHGTAREAVEASLRALKLDRLGALLSHERLREELINRFSYDICDLVRRGVVVRMGCSGSVGNVKYMLSKSDGAASIAQVPLHQHAEVSGIDETRLFNLGLSARRLEAHLTSVSRPRLDLLEAVPSRYRLSPTGAALAIVVAWVRSYLPKSVCIVNASTDERLSAVVLASIDVEVGQWVQAHDRVLQDAMAHAR